MKMMCTFLTFLLILLLITNCKKKNIDDPNVTTIDTTQTKFVKGADISWITQMEANGVKHYNVNGQLEDLYTILKTQGINTIRLRVWVNPTNGYNNVNDVLAKALRAKNVGMDILLNFHYSDTWADPGQQAPPTLWNAYTINELKTAVYNHTYNTLLTLKNNGVIVKWVQVGNETNNGMLWPLGKASTNMANFATLVNEGYNAVKAVDNNTKVIVHLSNGYDNSLYRWIFDGLKNNGAKWDIIGLSLYPTAANWPTLVSNCSSNMNDIISRYGSQVMVTEVGMPWDNAVVCNQFLTAIIAATKSLPLSKGLGVLYWEPECYNNWQGYTLGAFDNAGKPTIALAAFQ